MSEQSFNVLKRIATACEAALAALLAGKTRVASAAIGSVQTAAVGTNYTALSSAACNQVTITNFTGTQIEVRRSAAGTAFPIPDGVGYTFRAVTNANQLDVRRTDTSNTQVTVAYEAETF